MVEQQVPPGSSRLVTGGSRRGVSLSRAYRIGRDSGVARLLAADKIELQSEKGSHVTQRGRVLVMGGDQVYPVPKRRE